MLISKLVKASWSVPPLLRRAFSINALELKFDTFGDPRKVLRLEETRLEGDLGEGEAIVKFLACPINPADINTIQGTYGIKPNFPCCPGNEGVGVILGVGGSSTNLSIGDWVIPRDSGLGTWRSHLLCKTDKLIKVRNDMPVVGAATLSVNPCTAYRMLRDFVELKPDDVVIQNGANSAVGQNVIQMASQMKVKTINIVRDRKDIIPLKNYLFDLGATVVLADVELRLLKSISGLDKPKLALNCVGGKSSLELMKKLDKGGIMVTYGGMSHQPVTVSTASLIFNDVTLRGYWMTRWNKLHYESEERMNMIKSVSDMIASGKLKSSPHDEVPFVKFSDAFNIVMKASEGYSPNKQLLVFD